MLAAVTAAVAIAGIAGASIPMAAAAGALLYPGKDSSVNWKTPGKGKYKFVFANHLVVGIQPPCGTPPTVLVREVCGFAAQFGERAGPGVRRSGLYQGSSSAAAAAATSFCRGHGYRLRSSDCAVALN